MKYSDCSSLHSGIPETLDSTSKFSPAPVAGGDEQSISRTSARALVSFDEGRW